MSKLKKIQDKLIAQDARVICDLENLIECQERMIKLQDELIKILKRQLTPTILLEKPQGGSYHWDTQYRR